MFDGLKLSLLRYMKENFDDLLELDLKVARLMGAPAPHTISSYAYMLEREQKPVGIVLRPAIDDLFKWLADQPDHCKSDYESVTGQIS